MTRSYFTQCAFTLVELSVSLVIIGLLVGGVLVGKDLIHVAELRSIHEDSRKFTTAVYAFRDKYIQLPGDITNASNYFGSVPNGNGNSVIDYNGGSLGEEYYAWQHLSLAGLLAGTYTSATNSLPKSKISASAYRISFQTNVYGKNSHMISFNAYNTSGLSNAAILSPDDVFSIDAKYDDGKADQGGIMGFNQEGVPGCVTAYYTAGSGNYILPSSSITCKVFFKF